MDYFYFKIDLSGQKLLPIFYIDQLHQESLVLGYVK